MTISEMHVWFRQLAQQMGMQNVRALLPEQIDVLLNTSILDNVNQVIRENVEVTNDRIITDNSKIGQINALSTLFKVSEIKLDNGGYKYSYVISITPDETPVALYIKINGISYGDTSAPINVDNINLESLKDAFSGSNIIIDSVSVSNSITIGLHYAGSSSTNLNIEGEITTTGSEPGETETFTLAYNCHFNDNGELVVDSKTGDIDVEGTRVNSRNFSFDNEDYYYGLLKLNRDIIGNLMYIVDFSVQYKTGVKGLKTYGLPTYDTENPFKSNLYPIRIIEDKYLADTLNDFILKPRFRSPIVTIYNNLFSFYFGQLKGDTIDGYFLDGKLVPYIIRVSYISKPNKVYFGQDAGLPDVNCDLPEYMHVDIIKHAVDLYRQSISGGLQAQRNNDTANQQDVLRNNYRNEGYQQ